MGNRTRHLVDQRVGHLARRIWQCALALLLGVACTSHAQAQSESVLYSFNYSTGGFSPVGGVTLDPAGNVYGTTAGGGGYSVGVVFMLNTSGTETVTSFSGGNGSQPRASLTRDSAGNLYGTAAGAGPYDSGTLFKVDTTGSLTVLHNFRQAEGAHPVANLILDSTGNLYGTTLSGGSGKNGVVFELSGSNKFRVLYNFTGGADGGQPYGAVARDREGNLYGTAAVGGAAGHGVVFKVDPAGNETVLHSFAGSPGDGDSPLAGLAWDPSGNLYGTTMLGGASGYGVIFKVDRSGNETVLHSFAGAPTDGAFPMAGVIRDAAGNFYGTTRNGGSAGGAGAGTVFKLDPTGNVTVLHSFTGPDGATPESGVVLDAAGNLYGTTFYGGASNAGVVYQIKP